VVSIALPRDTREKLKRLIEKRDWRKLNKEASKIHPYDFSEFIQDLDIELQEEILANLNPEILAELLPELPEKRMFGFITLLSPRRAAGLLHKFPPDEMVDVLKELSREQRRRILRYFTKKEADEVRDLLRHPSDTAGGLMTTEVISLPKGTTVQEAIDYIRKKAREVETIYYVYVVDEDKKLVGVLSLRDLVIADPREKLEDIMNPNVIKVPADLDQEEVARITADYDLPVIPVVDDEERLVGIVTVDDVIDVIEEEVDEDLGYFAGTGEKIDKLIDAPALSVVKYRLPWLVFALIGDGLVAAYVLKAFEETLASLVGLALFMPVIMAMGGGVGVQSSTIVVRGIATREIDNWWRYFFREMKVGFIMGIIVGLGIAILAHIVVGKPILGLIVGMSMFVTMTLASITGIGIPKLFHYIGIDPAISSNPFITTTQDITGLFIYFGLATLMLHYLV
jgi:magnesium transporter